MAADGDFQTDVDRMLALVRERAGVDFLRYRPATVRRRILNRMLSAGVPQSADYVALLESRPDETWQLLERLTIKVSRFFRDRAVFDFLDASVLPEWSGLGRPVRIWSAGCARGEEAYSLAMLLVRHKLQGTVLATDVDPAALALARDGNYAASALSELGDDEIAMGFEANASEGYGFRVASAVRERVQFARHDLTSEVPASGRFDLICCRNVLIYFGPATQRLVQTSLVNSLHPGGLLCLGEAEWPDASVMPSLQAMPRRVRTFRRRP